jgi:putative proteasome-type protease
MMPTPAISCNQNFCAADFVFFTFFSCKFTQSSAGNQNMTFCVAVKTINGLVGLADTRIVNGSEQTSKSKLAQLDHPAGSLFYMTSGLRSVRDKAGIYFEQDLLQAPAGSMTHLFQVANLFGNCLKRVREEDGAALAAANLSFNTHAIIGGQFSEDAAPVLFYIYPQGNWVEATVDAPYHVIGRNSYGKPILDRFLTADCSLSEAIILSLLAFDATRASVTDVDFPVDMVVLDAATRKLTQRRFDAATLAHATLWWQTTLKNALSEFPLEWAGELISPPSGNL